MWLETGANRVTVTSIPIYAQERSGGIYVRVERSDFHRKFVQPFENLLMKCQNPSIVSRCDIEWILGTLLDHKLNNKKEIGADCRLEQWRVAHALKSGNLHFLWTQCRLPGCIFETSVFVENRWHRKSNDHVTCDNVLDPMDTKNLCSIFSGSFIKTSNWNLTKINNI